jgi:hypothetical protein
MDRELNAYGLNELGGRIKTVSANIIVEGRRTYGKVVLPKSFKGYK